MLAAARLDRTGRGGDAGLDLAHVERHADDAGRGHGDQLDRQTQVLSSEQPHAGGVGQALLAGAGVGVAGVHHDGLEPVADRRSRA